MINKCNNIANKILFIQVVHHHIKQDRILEFCSVWLNPDHVNFLFGFEEVIG